MNNKERKIVDLLKELKEGYGLIGVKTEFEGEGAQLDELCRLKDVTSKAGVDITLKIGGGEAATGIKMGRMLGVSRIVAPMIESSFALKKFILCAKKIYSEDELQDVGFGINIETITGYNQYEEMLQLPEFPSLDSVVYARGDMCGSLGKTFEYMDSDELRDMAADMFKRTKAKFPDMECMVGGVPSGKSFVFMQGIAQGLIDGYEGRKAIFEAPKQYDAKALEGFAKGIEFEILWCENKMEYYGAFAKEDEGKLNGLKKNHELTLGLI